MKTLPIQAQSRLDPKKRLIVKALLAFDSVKDPITRFDIIKGLSFYSQIVNHPQTDRHVENIVDACSTSPSGFKELLDQLALESPFGEYEELVQAVGMLANARAPTDLPKLCDRDPQHELLGSVLRSVFSKAGAVPANRPIVFVFDGHESQAYEDFLDALKTYYFYVYYPVARDIYGFDHRRFVLPKQLESNSNFNRQLWKNLSRAWEIYDKQEPATFAVAVHSHPGPVLVSADMRAEEWGRDGMERVKGFLGFWNEWPEVPVTHPILACLCVRYKERLRGPRRLARLFRGDPEAEIRTRLASIDKSMIEDYRRILGLRLPTLRGVSAEAAEAWVLHPRVTPYTRNQELKRAVEKLYEPGGPCVVEYDDTEKLQRVPMRTMIDRLYTILYS